jgi:membrane protease YdiL (CAAX protease family)
VTEDPFGEQPIAPAALPEQPHRWRGRDITFFTLGFFLLFVLLNVVVIGLVNFIPFRGESADALRALSGTLFVEVTLIGLIAAVIRFVYRLRFFEEMRWRRDYEMSNVSLLVKGAALAFSVMLVSAMFPPSSPPIERLLSTPQAVIAFAIFGIGFAPFLEEMMFRGFLFRMLEEIAGSSIAVRTTAVLFALLHVPQLWGSRAGMLVIFAVGYVLSDLRERTGSMIPPVIVHTAYNGMLFLAFALSTLAQESA